MIKKIKNYMAAFALVFGFAAAPLVPATAFAENTIQTALCNGSEGAINGQANSGCTTTSEGEGTLASVASRVVNLLSVVVGIIAVIMIIIGGFRYITSGGESSKVGGAKNTLIYAIVGLIIVALAQFIVRFVLQNTNNIS